MASTTGSRVLAKMLDRLLAGLMSGPNMNCRPHNSRQRVDLTSLSKLQDIAPEKVLETLLAPEKCAKVIARVKLPRKPSIEEKEKSPADKAAGDKAVGDKPAGEKSPAEKAWIEQSALLSKLRLIADDARTYENDTGVHALSIGFPILSLPPGSFAGGGARSSTKRILAPIAFIPVTLSLKAGATPSVEISCRGEGENRVSPNTALLSWIEQQTGKPQNPDAFEDEEGVDPWREIGELVKHVAEAMRLNAPDLPRSGRPEGARGDEGGKPESEGKPAADVEPSVESQPAAEPLGSALRGETAPLTLLAAPRGDDDSQQPAILLSAVLGLFPTAHQGLLRDTRAMAADSAPLNGPIQSFLTSGIDFDAPISPATPAPAQVSNRTITTDRLAAAADPCQARAVALSREAAGLVVHGPPGTGKSQTITNIIADHLARGQRVLLVCEKRTALDVVANRLEHMGLRSLCGIVHDPQRDQRDLYRSIHEQLAELPDAKLYPRAQAGLKKIDAELQQLHAELTGFHQSLMETDDRGLSFHELMGRWMASQDAPAVRLEAAGISIEQLESQATALQEMLRRAEAVDYSRNVWSKCAGIVLGDFLSRQMSEIRTAMDRIASAAQLADQSADPRIVPFSDAAPLPLQTRARMDLAAQLPELFPALVETHLAELATKDLPAVRALRTKIESLKAEIAIFRAGPIDLALMAFVASLPGVAQIQRDLFSLQQYLDVAGKFSAIFAFAIKSEATKVLKQYALRLGVENANRAKTFLIALQARVTLLPLVAASSLSRSSLSGDEAIEHFLKTADLWLPLLEKIATEPALVNISPALAKLFVACGFAPSAEIDDFFEGLKLSTPRGEAILRLDEQLSASQLFNAAWQRDFESSLRHGKLAADTAAALSDRLGSLEGVLRVNAARTKLPKELAPVAEQLLSQVVGTDEAMRALNKKVLTEAITQRLRSNPALLASDAHRIESSFQRYRELDQQKKKLVREAICHLWVSKQKERLLSGTGTRLNSTGADLRRRLTSRGERAMRLRQVIAIGSSVDGGDPLFDLCPVWMASPETVAQIFPRSALFDVVVFDEASQCRLEEALPVLTRGKRVVIAGDPNQLPPTRFFESGLVQSEDEDPQNEQELFESQQGEVEDLLAAALNLSIQQCYLDVHYRSRNADLIEFSNQNFYASRLQAIPGHPANRSKFSPLTLYRVDGVYNKRQNEAEADRVVQIVADLLKRAEPPSIGVACLNLPQRDLIVEKLDERAAEDGDFAKRLAAARVRKGQGSFEGLFVKNLENVQGDERDDIIISTTYGPDTKRKFYRRFGPVGMAGGRRRLNVLVTRARNEVHLVTSIPAESYRSLPAVPEGQAATGAWLLFAYLKYAEELAASYRQAKGSDKNHTPNLESASDAEAASVKVLASQSPSVFSKELAGTLARGSKIGSDVFWGNEGFCVDLALHHPVRAGDVTIGVLCDGCRYLAAEDVVEWDIFRTGILADQGWVLRRIWTPHFFRDPQGSLKEISDAAAEFVATEKPADTIPTQIV
jgi:hypothetical protein